ncbi:hypothetical protein FACS1894217_08460 [Clostridia bacterium]|nr:hypothetical protein FACS1894217_08460 [Clostridia bacterium]
MTCKDCGTEVTSTESALNRKLIARSLTEFMCMDCLAEYFRVDRAVLEQRVVFFRENGCGLFV